ncbi:MAG: ribose-5-phosphate isomerase RpiA [Labrys sp. (in: a-proteobacteria)]
MSIDQQKRAAAAQALLDVSDGMRLGLGTGSTAAHFVDLLGERVRAGLSVICVPTSEVTARQASALGIPLTTLDETPHLDLTIDGADEIGPDLTLIKGGGGALLREKIVAAASTSMTVIADDSKLVSTLGAFALPVEVVPFGMEATRLAMADRAARLGLEGKLTPRRTRDGLLFVTDGGHHIVDCAFSAIPNPIGLAAGLAAIPGVVEHGLFLGLARKAIIAGDAGIRVLRL